MHAQSGVGWRRDEPGSGRAVAQPLRRSRPEMVAVCNPGAGDGGEGARIHKACQNVLRWPKSLFGVFP